MAALFAAPCSDGMLEESEENVIASQEHTIDMKSIIVLFVAFLFISIHTQAQEGSKSNRITLSYEAMNLNWQFNDGPGAVKGISAGYARVSQIGTKTGLAIEYGGKISWLHSVEKEGYEDEITHRSTFMNISLPVNLTRPFTIGNSDFSVSPFVGPNFKFNLMGKEKRTWDSIDCKKNTRTNFLSREERFPAKIFQFGINIGAGFRFKDFYAGYTFQPDLTKYRKGEGELEYNYECKTHTSIVSVGFYF